MSTSTPDSLFSRLPWHLFRGPSLSTAGETEPEADAEDPSGVSNGHELPADPSIDPADADPHVADPPERSTNDPMADPAVSLSSGSLVPRPSYEEVGHHLESLKGVLAKATGARAASLRAGLDQIEQFIEQSVAGVTPARDPLALHLTSTPQEEFRTQREQILALAQRFDQAQDQETLLHQVVLQTRQLLQVDRAVIYLFQNEVTGKVVAESVSRGFAPALGESLPAALFGLEQSQEYDQQPILAVQAQAGHDLTPYQRHLWERYQITALLNVRLALGGQIWGLLSVHRCSPSTRPWDEADLNLLYQIGTLVTLRMQILTQELRTQHQLSTQATALHQALERERLASKIVERLRQSLDLNALFKTTVSEVRRFMAADRVGVFQFYPDCGYDDGEFVAEDVVAGYSSALAAKIHDHCFGDQFADKYKQGRIQAVADIHGAGLSDCHIQVLSQLQVRANLIVPLLKGSQLWGLLCIHQCSGPREWRMEEIDLVKGIAAQFSVALQQSEYVSQIEAKSAQIKRVAEREADFSRLVYRVGQLIVEGLRHQRVDPYGLFRDVTQELRQILKVDRAALYRFNPDWSGEFIAESVGAGWTSVLDDQQRDEYLRRDTTSSDRCIVKDLARRGADTDTYMQETRGGDYQRGKRYTVVEDVYAQDFDPCYIRRLEKYQAKAYIIVPVFLGDQAWGLLAVYQNDGPRAWEQGEIDLLMQVATQMGIVLQQGRYLEQIQSQSQQLTAAAERERQAKETLQQGVIQLLSSVRPVLEGDLTVRVPIGEDEVGTMADVYNNTIQSLRQLVTQVKLASTQVTQTSQGSEASVAQLSRQAQQQFAEIAQALEQVQAMVSSVQAVAINATQVQGAVRQADERVRQGEGTINRTVGAIQTIRGTVSATAKQIKQLSQSSQKISKVVSLITSFATQTNLLALNAAIEATRAGEYGRGFAVVADEVRSLARQSAGASSEIEKWVTEIQSETHQVAMAMETGIQQVVQGTELVAETRQELNAIRQATGEIRRLVEGITAATEAQTRQSQQVTQVMNGVAAIANRTTEDTEQLTVTFQALLATAATLQESVGQFKLS